MSNAVKIVECPRDAWQGLSGHLPVEVKTEYLRRLIEAGFRHIDAVSFVSPRAVPQMADSEEVLRYLMPPEDVEIIGIVVNEKGAERAVRSGAVQTIGFPYSISTEFLQRNQNQTPDEAIDALEAVGTHAYKAGLDMVAYLSMAFGNPYGEPWSIDEAVNACELLADSGVQQISLADTVGLATPAQIADTLAEVIPKFHDIEIGVHLHTRPRDAAARISAAYAAGCRRFDSAIGGLGGCPFAQDALVGNIATETLLEVLHECGAELPELGPLQGLMRASAAIAAHFGTAVSQPLTD